MRAILVVLLLALADADRRQDHQRLHSHSGRGLYPSGRGLRPSRFRKTTWGEADRQLLAIRAEAAGKAEVATCQLWAGLRQDHDAELRQRQAAADALDRWTYQRQILAQNQQAISAMNAMNRSRSTNCQYVGGVLNCSTF